MCGDEDGLAVIIAETKARWLHKKSRLQENSNYAQNALAMCPKLDHGLCMRQSQRLRGDDDYKTDRKELLHQLALTWPSENTGCNRDVSPVSS